MFCLSYMNQFFAKLVLVLVLIALPMLVSVSFGQSIETSSKSIEIVRLTVAPDIDGVIGKSEWADATTVVDLHEVEPVEFSVPSERTVWYIAYDEKALYVAAYAYDSEPDAIVAQTLREGGNLGSDDTLGIIVDAFNNKRSGLRIHTECEWRPRRCNLRDGDTPFQRLGRNLARRGQTSGRRLDHGNGHSV